MTRVDVHHFEHLVVPLLLLLWAHGQTTVDGSRYVAQIPRVDLESFGHVVGDAHEFGEDERTLFGPLLRDHKLHGSGVHAVSKRGDESEISDGEEGVEFVLLDRLVVMVNGNEIQRPVLAIDVGYQFGDLTFQLGRVGESRRGDLDQDDLSDPFGEVLQQFFECAKL